MTEKNFEARKGAAEDSRTDSKPAAPQTNPQPDDTEGNYQNIETSVNRKEDFGDDYESEQEDEITREEARTEKEGRTGKS